VGEKLSSEVIGAENMDVKIAPELVVDEVVGDARVVVKVWDKVVEFMEVVPGETELVPGETELVPGETVTGEEVAMAVLADTLECPPLPFGGSWPWMIL